MLTQIQEHQKVIAELEKQIPVIQTIAEKMMQVIYNKGTIFWLGNGGSAADAQHMAAELVGRFKKERPAIASIALTTDTSILTALTNDYDYSIVFARQLEALCRVNDLVVGISTSGNSENILKGMITAKKQGAFTIGLSGDTGGQLAEYTDICLCISSKETARIQEAHILVGHLLCEYIDNHS